MIPPLFSRITLPILAAPFIAIVWFGVVLVMLPALIALESAKDDDPCR